MIYETIKAAVEEVPDLAGKCFPAGVCIDEVAPPFACYIFGKRTPARDLAGRVHHYTDEVTVDLLAEDYDRVHDLSLAVEEVLFGLANGPDGAGAWIFGVDCDAPESDGADLSLGLMRRSLRCTLQWCPLEPDG